MLDLNKDIRSLSDFKRDTATLMRKMKKHGRPLVLTVNGRAEVVVQDAAAYQRMLDLAARAEAVLAIRQGLSDLEAGRVRDARQALDRMQAELGIPPKDHRVGTR
jgi:prevent-host-death family protein